MKIGCKDVPDIEFIFNNGNKIIFENLKSFNRKAINNFDFNDIIEFEVCLIDLDFYKRIAQDQIRAVNIINNCKTDTGENYTLTQTLTLPKIELHCGIDCSGSVMTYKIIITKK